MAFRHRARISTLFLAALACCALCAASRATGCRRDIVVPIHFHRGAVCWRHAGIGTTFNGEFDAGQHVTATAIGQTYNSDGRRTWVTTGPWQISVSGPGGFFAAAKDNGQLDTVLPRSGRYSFSIGPCAVWGNRGTVEICTH